MEKLWTTREVAEVLGIQEVDVEQLVREGKLTGYKLGGQFLRFRPSQVEALKGKIQFRRHVTQPKGARKGSQLNRLQDFFYFHDFYIMSFALLAILIIYLMVSA